MLLHTSVRIFPYMLSHVFHISIYLFTCCSYYFHTLLRSELGGLWVGMHSTRHGQLVQRTHMTNAVMWIRSEFGNRSDACIQEQGSCLSDPGLRSCITEDPRPWMLNIKNSECRIRLLDTGRIHTLLVCI